MSGIQRRGRFFVLESCGSRWLKVGPKGSEREGVQLLERMEATHRWAVGGHRTFPPPNALLKAHRATLGSPADAESLIGRPCIIHVQREAFLLAQVRMFHRESGAQTEEGGETDPSLPDAGLERRRRGNEPPAEVTPVQPLAEVREEGRGETGGCKKRREGGGTETDIKKERKRGALCLG